MEEKMKEKKIDPRVKWTLTLLIVLVFFSSPARAADWQFYGIAKLRTFVNEVDNKDDAPDTLNYAQYLYSNSKIGARVRVNDNLRARFEYGIEADVRKLWGEWKFAGARLKVGQDYTPIYMDYCLEEYGGLSGGRRPMIQLSFKGFKIAVIQPRAKKFGTSGVAAHTTLPKLEASYNKEIGKFSFEVAGGINTYELVGQNQTYKINAYILGLGAELRLNQAYFAANIYTGQNLTPYGMIIATDGNPAITDGGVRDNKGFGFVLLGRYSFNDRWTIEAGVGQQESRLEQAPATDDVQACYILSKINLSENVYLIPEIGLIDQLHDTMGKRGPRTLYYGIEWQIYF